MKARELSECRLCGSLCDPGETMCEFHAEAMAVAKAPIDSDFDRMYKAAKTLAEEWGRDK